MAKRLTILAGAGRLVGELVDAALSDGWDVQVVDFTGTHTFPHISCTLGRMTDPFGVVAMVRRFKTTHVCLVGRVTVTQKDRSRAFSLFGGAKRRKGGRGDAMISRLVGAFIGVTGAKLVGVHEIMPQVLAPAGLIAGGKPTSGQLATARFGFEMAAEIGNLDIGQAVVVGVDHVIAVEDLAGTDALLDRIATYRDQGLLEGDDGDLVLAKRAKPQQIDSIDMPAIGPETIERARQAGVGMIVIEAQRTLLIEREALCVAAEAAGITLYGLERDDA